MIIDLKVMCEVTVNDTVMRFWEGSSVFVDKDGNQWYGSALQEGSLDEIEAAINGEASSFNISLLALDESDMAHAWNDYENGDIIGAGLRILILEEHNAGTAPDGLADTSMRVEFTGRVDDVLFNEIAGEDGVTASMTLEVVNRFTLRSTSSGSVLSDVDQKAHSRRLNPDAAPDRFCERIPSLAEKTINWPAFN
jgi:hypothetical protein